jgi:hypothetical protein
LADWLSAAVPLLKKEGQETEYIGYANVIVEEERKYSVLPYSQDSHVLAVVFVARMPREPSDRCKPSIRKDVNH